ncbi:MAG: transposase, partial [Candidatus Marinimicrobia bacterium]|nr:transposase [Candidatus Neomarinimicrobiota bacterium]
CFTIIKNIFLLVFTGKNWYRIFMDSRSKPKFGKDVVYRFLNSAKWQWDELLLSLSTNVISWITTLTSDTRNKVLIADDTFYDRTRSKAVELLSWVYDHVDGKSKKGFTKLTLGWSDGHTFLPIQFRLVSSSNHKKIKTTSVYVKEKYPGYNRRIQAKKKKTELLFDMVQAVIDNSIQYSHLLFDSWFAFPKIITRFKKMGVNIVTMLKKTPKIFYTFRDKEYCLARIYSLTKSRMDKKTKRFSVLVWVNNYNEGVKTKARILFIREKKKWLALLSTDLDLNEEEIIKIYGMRWNIEIFFKMCKSHLKLAKEFQGRSFDMLVAHTSIVYIRYIMIAVMVRKNDDERTFGDLFFYFSDEVRNISFFEALQLILSLLKNFLKDKFLLSEEVVQRLLSDFIDSLPPILGKNLPGIMCES